MAALGACASSDKPSASSEFEQLERKSIEALRAKTHGHAAGWGLGAFDRWDQFAVPAENRVWRSDGREGAQRLPSKHFALHSETSAMVAAEAERL